MTSRAARLVALAWFSLLGGGVSIGAQSHAFDVPAWALPIELSPLPIGDTIVRHGVPGSRLQHTMRRAYERFDIIDWFPESHTAAPASVMRGRRPATYACGFCHLPDGAGRPENATLAGLPAEYIIGQMRAFRDGSRGSPYAHPSRRVMNDLAQAVTDAEVAEAAAYFATRRLARRNVVLEVDSLPRTRIAFLLFVKDGAGMEPIDGRLIEVPEDLKRHELHDPTVTYVTYVPKGTLAAGKRVVESGTIGRATACGSCHGPQLLGAGIVPPIAGRSPSYLLRQLIAMRRDVRRNKTSAPMLPVVNTMTFEQMVAVAAYVGSLAPSPVTSRR